MQRALVLVAVVVGVAACGAAAPPPPQAPVKPATPVAPPPEPSEQIGIPANYIEATIERVVDLPEGGAVLVADEGTNTIVPIFIGGTEAYSIQLRMRGSAPQRPLTHDLLDSMVVKLKASIVKVQIDELRDGVYIGSVFVRSAGHIYRLDARPSDAIALAIGNKVPIYVAKQVIETAGQPRDEIMRQINGPVGGPST